MQSTQVICQWRSGEICSHRCKVMAYLLPVVLRVGLAPALQQPFAHARVPSCSVARDQESVTSI